jgi:hypothetical protein
MVEAAGSISVVLVLGFGAFILWTWLVFTWPPLAALDPGFRCAPDPASPPRKWPPRSR